MASTSKEFEADDTEVTGVSRSGRVCKKSSKLIYFDSATTTINNKKRSKVSKIHQKPKKSKNLENFDEQNQPQVSYNDYSTSYDVYNCESQEKSVGQQKQEIISCESISKKIKTELNPDAPLPINYNDSLPINSETESDSTLMNNEIQTPDYTSSDEDSLNSHDELLISKVDISTSEPKRDCSTSVSVETKMTVNTQNYGYTGYKLWSSEMRKEILKKYPSIDITIMTIRLGEMWTKLSINNRNNWHDQAQHLTEKAESYRNMCVMDNEKQDWLTSCNSSGVGEHQMRQSCSEIKLRTVELQPIDVAAHFNLLGESLILIGAKLKQRDKPVPSSDYITVLMDSLLCVMGTLMCLTLQVPIFKTDNSETFLRMLDNIAYIMPGL